MIQAFKDVTLAVVGNLVGLDPPDVHAVLVHHPVRQVLDGEFDDTTSNVVARVLLDLIEPAREGRVVDQELLHGGCYRRFRVMKPGIGIVPVGEVQLLAGELYLRVPTSGVVAGVDGDVRGSQHCLEEAGGTSTSGGPVLRIRIIACVLRVVDHSPLHHSARRDPAVLIGAEGVAVSEQMHHAPGPVQHPGNGLKAGDPQDSVISEEGIGDGGMGRHGAANTVALIDAVGKVEERPTVQEKVELLAP